MHEIQLGCSQEVSVVLVAVLETCAYDLFTRVDGNDDLMTSLDFI